MEQTAAEFREFYDNWPDYEKDVLGGGWRGPRQLAKHLKPYLKGKEMVLDVGCGPGILGNELQKLRWRGFLVGTDISSQQLKRAGSKMAYGACVLMNCYHLGFPRDTFDIVASSGVVGLTGPGSVREMYRVLKRNGYLAIVAGKIIGDEDLSETFKSAIACLKNLPRAKILLRKNLGKTNLNGLVTNHLFVLYIIQKL